MPEMNTETMSGKPTRRWTTGGPLSILPGNMGRRSTDTPWGEAAKPANSLRVLLQHLVDYAGLFPPAGLDMKTAVANYARYREGVSGWMLGRFVVPATRLGELSDALERLSGKHPLWKASVIAGEKLLGDLAAIRQFNQRHDGRVLIDAMEMKASTPDEVRRAREYVDESIALFVEIPANNPGEMFDAIKLGNAHAKLRTGGTSQEMVPSVEDVARFLVASSKAKVAFKATAGLHHPVRCVKPFTYEKDSASGLMHGFLNVFVAATIARVGASEQEVAQVLSADLPEQFSFADDGATVRALAGEQEYHVSTELFSETRRSFAVSFGSCSFEEPIEDLRSIQLL